MRKLLFASLLAVATLNAPSVLACPGHDGKAAQPKEQKAEHMKSASFKVEKMSCEGCASKIQTALAGTDGVLKITISVADHRISVDYDADKLTAEKIAKVISDLGYPATAEV